MKFLTLPILSLVLTSVGMICLGQLLFKAVGLRLQEGAAFWEPKVAALGILSIGIYGVATLLWIYVLRTVPLTKAYPFMALSFVLVPIGGVYLFGEHVRSSYILGAALIVAGVLLTTLSDS